MVLICLFLGGYILLGLLDISLKRNLEMKHPLYNRIKKAKKNNAGKKVVSKGVLSQVRQLEKASKTKAKKNSKNKYKLLRKQLKEFGFEKIKIVNNHIISTRYEGQTLNEQQSHNKARELGIIK